MIRNCGYLRQTVAYFLRYFRLVLILVKAMFAVFCLDLLAFLMLAIICCVAGGELAQEW